MIGNPQQVQDRRVHLVVAAMAAALRVALDAA